MCPPVIQGGIPVPTMTLQILHYLWTLVLSHPNPQSALVHLFQPHCPPCWSSNMPSRFSPRAFECAVPCALNALCPDSTSPGPAFMSPSQRDLTLELLLQPSVSIHSACFSPSDMVPEITPLIGSFPFLSPLHSHMNSFLLSLFVQQIPGI